MASLQNGRLPGEKQDGVGVHQDHRQVVSVVLECRGRLGVQFINDPGDGVFGLWQPSGCPDQPIGVVPPAVSLHGLDDQRHEGRVGGKRLGEVAHRPIPNLNVGMPDGFLDLVFGVSHDALPVRVLATLFNYSSSSAYCGGLLPTRFVTLGNLPLGALSSMASTLIWCHQSSPKSNQ